MLTQQLRYNNGNKVLITLFLNLIVLWNISIKGLYSKVLNVFKYSRGNILVVLGVQIVIVALKSCPHSALLCTDFPTQIAIFQTWHYFSWKPHAWYYAWYVWYYEDKK